jgi:hypothetical protein
MKKLGTPETLLPSVEGNGGVTADGATALACVEPLVDWCVAFAGVVA